VRVERQNSSSRATGPRQIFIQRVALHYAHIGRGVVVTTRPAPTP
jgi:hypothetical protein